MCRIFDRLTLTTDTGNLQQDVGYSKLVTHLWVLCVMPKRKKTLYLLLLNGGGASIPLNLWRKSPSFPSPPLHPFSSSPSLAFHYSTHFSATFSRPFPGDLPPKFNYGVCGGVVSPTPSRSPGDLYRFCAFRCLRWSFLRPVMACKSIILHNV